jgi:hypothetical protein
MITKGIERNILVDISFVRKSARCTRIENREAVSLDLTARRERATKGEYMTEQDKIAVKRIAFLMKQSGHDVNLVDKILNSAMEFEGQYDLMCLWRDASDAEERDECISALVECLKDIES